MMTLTKSHPLNPKKQIKLIDNQVIAQLNFITNQQKTWQKNKNRKH